jgi:hypothetical protein
MAGVTSTAPGCSSSGILVVTRKPFIQTLIRARDRTVATGGFTARTTPYVWASISRNTHASKPQDRNGL